MESYGQAGKVAEEVFAAFRTVLAFNAQTSEQTRHVKQSTQQFKFSTKLSVSENDVKLTSDNQIKITFDNVSFSYPSRQEKPVLNNVSFTVSAGKTVAFVGSSGSGKSTCVQLLLRFYELTNGQITINDRNIAEFDIYDYNQVIGVVSQEAVLFATSIQDNIRFGKKNATQDDVIKAAKQGYAHDFIMKLPQGYDTMVGERGVKLSGGQRQRIALARALIREPNLLILDEATSALDASSEKIVQQALEQASKGRRTTIVIAHRLSTIRHADWIVVMKDGAVIEQGSHEDLIAANNVYCDLFKNYQGENLNVQSSEVVNMQESEEFSTEIIRDEELNSIRTMEKEENVTSFETEETEPMIDESSFGSLRSLINLLKLNGPEWPYLIIASLFTIASCAVSPAFSISMAQAINGFNECTISAQMNKIYIFTSIIFALGIAAVIFTVIAQGCLSLAGARLTNRLRAKAFGCILRQEVGWFDEAENSIGSLCSRLSTDALEIQKVCMEIWF
ncbi:unnamed protein product [Rotaria sp. Silwood2]|nr:unnamed protein product [Rotaria sp. Silwood2]